MTFPKYNNYDTLVYIVGFTIEKIYIQNKTLSVYYIKIYSQTIVVKNIFVYIYTTYLCICSFIYYTFSIQNAGYEHKSKNLILDLRCGVLVRNKSKVYVIIQGVTEIINTL